MATPDAEAVLVVNQNLGTLGLGVTNLTGDTANSGMNNADIYTSAGTTTVDNWGNEWVYEFTITSTFSVSLQSNALTGDPDAFLLNSLDTVANGAKNDATGAFGLAFLDNPPPQTGGFGNIGPGTYYLSIDSYIGVDGGLTPGDATFDYNLILGVPAMAPTALHLGPLAVADAPFTLDTLGSGFDTELGIWNAGGDLILVNDDEPGGTFQSELDLFVGLPAGIYYVGLGGWDTVYGDTSWSASGGGDSGVYNFNFPGGTLSDNLTAGEVAFFSFDVVPEPSSALLVGFAASLILLRRRRG